MTVNPLPPQAYTKETLQKAYAWLLNQSPSVKEMAGTQDMLISLYLKAQRNGEASLETPSIQNFKQELKNLASMIGDLQTNPAQQPVLQQASPPVAPMAAASFAPPQTPFTPPPPQNAASYPTSPQVTGQLDALSLQMIAEVRASLNLSSDVEALRAIISMGHRQFRKLQS